jgi:excisionase family DNA binding protein
MGKQQMSVKGECHHANLERMMRIDEVAYLLGVSTRSVWRLIASGEFPNRVKVRRCVRLPGSDVQAYLVKNKHQ